MNRRRLLVGVGVSASSLLAGCLGGEDPSGAGTTASTETETTMTTSATTTATRTSAGESTTARSTDEPTTRSETSTVNATESPGSQTTDGTRTTNSPTRSSTASGSSAIVDRTLTVGDRACGNPTNEGTVAFEDRRVVASGTITGSDSCATAVLEEATVDAGADRLRIVVATESEREEGTTCAQCLTEIGYEATVAFAEEVPRTVVLVHRGATGERRVTTATAPSVAW